MEIEFEKESKGRCRWCNVDEKCLNRERMCRACLRCGEGAKYIYLITADGDNYVKIGLSRKHPHHGRISELETSCPFRLSVFLARRVDHPNRVERELHEKYSAFRLKGEWFRLDRAQMELLKADLLAYPERPERPEPVRPAVKPRQRKNTYKSNTFGHTVKMSDYSFPNLVNHYRGGTGPFKIGQN